MYLSPTRVHQGLILVSLPQNASPGPTRTRAAHTHLPLVDGDPVGGVEPLVALNVVDAVLEVAVALGEVDLQQVTQQVLQVGAEVGWVAHLTGTDTHR